MEKSGPPLFPGFNEAVWGMNPCCTLTTSGVVTSPIVAITLLAAPRG